MTLRRCAGGLQLEPGGADGLTMLLRVVAEGSDLPETTGTVQRYGCLIGQGDPAYDAADPGGCDPADEGVVQRTTDAAARCRRMKVDAELHGALERRVCSVWLTAGEAEHLPTIASGEQLMGTCSPELLKPGHSFDEVSGPLVKCGEPSDDMVAVDGIDRLVLSLWALSMTMAAR